MLTAAITLALVAVFRLNGYVVDVPTAMVGAVSAGIGSGFTTKLLD